MLTSHCYQLVNVASRIKTTMNQRALDNRSNQLNPNNAQFWKSRGYDGIPSAGASSPSSLGSFRSNSQNSSQSPGGSWDWLSTAVNVASALVEIYSDYSERQRNRNQ